MTHLIIDAIRHHLFSGLELTAFAERALHETGATGAAIALQQGERFVCCASIGETAPAVDAVVDAHSGLTGICIRSGAAVICPDTSADPRVDGTACEELGIASVIAVPIVRSGATVGVIEALSRELNAFGPEQQTLLEAIAREIGEPYFGVDHLHESAASGASEPGASEPVNSDIPSDDHSNGDAPQPSVAFNYDAERADESGRIRRAALIPMVLSAALGAGLLLYSHFTHGVGVTSANDSSAASLFRQPSTTPGVVGESAQPQSDTLETSPASADLDSLERAARHGEVSAEMELASRLSRGTGIGQDSVLACAWYTLAAISGQQDATDQLAAILPHLSKSEVAQVRIQLGQMFSNGIGVTRDLTSAYTWFLLAVAAGSHDAAERKQELATEMTPTQIAESRRRANEWLVQHHLPPVKDE